MPEINPLRLISKALIMFVVINLAFATLNPPMGRLTIYNWLVRGRERFAYGNLPAAYNITVDDLDALFASHIISNGPKDASEYRVLVLGDSSTWGWTTTTSQTLVGQLDREKLSECGKHLKFYNLGYPVPSVLRDFLVLNKGLKYKPDLVVWMLTTFSFSLIPEWTPFMISNGRDPEAVSNILHQYGLDRYRKLISPAPMLLERTLLSERYQLSKLVLLQLYGLLWDATGIDNVVQYQPLVIDLPANQDYLGKLPPHLPVSSMSFDVLEAAHRMIGDIPVIIVNEPIYMASGRNSNIRYNIRYPRWAYDQYRQLLPRLAAQQGWAYSDLYNLVPSSEFANPAFHLTPDGEKRLAQALAPEIARIKCP